MAERQHLLAGAVNNNANKTTDRKISTHDQEKKSALHDAKFPGDSTRMVEPQPGRNGGLVKDAVAYPISNGKQQHAELNRYQSIPSIGARVATYSNVVIFSYDDAVLFCCTTVDYLMKVTFSDKLTLSL
jgi:hypothetical protein